MAKPREIGILRNEFGGPRSAQKLGVFQIMNRRTRDRWGKRGSLLGLSLVLGALTLTAVAYAADLLKVVQEEASIRKDKRMLGTPKVATVHEGDLVTMLAEEESWYQVEWNGVKGWLPRTAVSTDLKLEGSKEALADGVRPTEQSAAKRGFNEQVEKEYRASRADLDAAFKVLEGIQARKFPEESVAQFLRQGKLGEQVAQAGAPPSPPAPSKAVSSKEGRATPPWKQ